MTRNEYLLIQLCSEAIEVAHRCTKAQHFGLDQVQAGHTLTNGERISEEITDLIATMRMCVDEKMIPKPDLGRPLTAKQQKVERFMAYAMGGERPADDAGGAQ